MKKAEIKMTITTYQIRNVLRLYGNQLKRRSNFLENGMEPTRSSSELVDISVEARRRQVLNQLSTKLISELNPGGYAKKPQIP